MVYFIDCPHWPYQPGIAEEYSFIQPGVLPPATARPAFV